MSRDASPDGQVWLERMPVGLALWLAALVVWGTWAPFVRTLVPEVPGFGLPDRPLEVLGNLLLMAPLGLVVGLSGRGVPVRTRVARAALAGAAWSVAVEVGQVFVAERISSVVDVLLNTAGSGGAAMVGVALVHRGVRGTALVAVTAAGVWLAAAGYVAIGYDHAQDEFRVAWWNPGFPIIEGNEHGGGRAFRGTILESRICAGRGTSRVCAAPGAERSQREALTTAARRSQFVELTARVRPAADWQPGPARILTFSLGAEVRNATLGQQGTALNFRLRTPLSGQNGSRPGFVLPDVFTAAGETSLLARFDDRQVTL